MVWRDECGVEGRVWGGGTSVGSRDECGVEGRVWHGRRDECGVEGRVFLEG